VEIILSEDDRSLSDSGSNKRLGIPNGWLSGLDMQDEDEVSVGLIKAENQTFFAAWVGEKPDFSGVEDDR